MLDLADFADLQTEFGVPVRNLRLKGGHYLVYKVPMADNPFFVLPDVYKSRAVKNIVAIKGFVLRSSEPFHPKKAKRYWEWDMKQDPPVEMPKYKTVTLPETEASVQPGDCVLYNSYNIAKVAVEGHTEPLVIIRDVDLLATWRPEVDSRVALSDHAIQHIVQKVPE